MRGKLIGLQLKIGSEISQCTDITDELEDLNFKLEEFRNLMSGNRPDIRLFKEFRRQVQSTIWLSHSLNLSMVKILDEIKQDIADKEIGK
jgi:hypothetical protein